LQPPREGNPLAALTLTLHFWRVQRLSASDHALPMLPRISFCV
jgi:hypothetical protein